MVIWKKDFDAKDPDSKRQMCSIEGTVGVGNQPKFRQVGDDDTV
jgi:hypothetical protein